MSSFEEEFDDDEEEEKEKMNKEKIYSEKLKPETNEGVLNLPDTEEDEFQYQLRLEASEHLKLNEKKTKVDDDGTVFEWDEERRAWFPKIDEVFLTNYNMNFGSDVEAELNQKRKLEWEEYYEKINQMNSMCEGNSDEQQKLLQEYYNSSEYRTWYNTYYGSQNFNDAESKMDESQSTTLPVEDQSSLQPDKKKRKKPKKPADSWYELDDSNNTHVYISGLPLDITEEEFEKLMSKCGLIMNEPFSDKKRLKLYRDASGNFQGDGRCCYIKVESVELALNILDGFKLRDCELHVERAKFQKKENFDSKTARRRLTEKEKKKIKEHQENLFRWGSDSSKFFRPKRDRSVILKNVFSAEKIMDNPLFLEDIKGRISSYLSHCGSIKRITVYENNEEGVVRVDFGSAEEADIAISYSNGRLLPSCPFHKSPDGPVLDVQTWDGKTNFFVQETESDKKLRLEKWHNFIKCSEVIFGYGTCI